LGDSGDHNNGKNTDMMMSIKHEIETSACDSAATQSNGMQIIIIIVSHTESNLLMTSPTCQTPALEMTLTLSPLLPPRH